MFRIKRKKSTKIEIQARKRIIAAIKIQRFFREYLRKKYSYLTKVKLEGLLR